MKKETKYKIQFFNQIEWVDSIFFVSSLQEAIDMVNFLNSGYVVYKYVIDE